MNTISSAVILVGGNSRRMGCDKNLITFNGKRMIDIIIDSLYQLFDDIVIVTNDPERYKFYDPCGKIKITQDKFSHLKKSSLRGIYAGLEEINYQYGFVFAGDMPFISYELVKAMLYQLHDNRKKTWDVVIPVIGEHFEPLFALYHKNCLQVMKHNLLSEQYKIIDALDYYRVLKVSEQFCEFYDPTLMSFFNVNTPEQLQKAQKYYRQLHS